MVAASVPRFLHEPKPCYARPMLFASLECYDAGDYIGAGVRLREAVVRFLVGACDWYGIELKRIKYPRPVDYIRALDKAGELGQWGREFLLEMLECGNAAAHCGKFDKQTLKGAISILFSMMDGQPYCPTDRNPLVTSQPLNPYDMDDCDDDDGSDWWKGGAA